ncbi:hypothetical protein [Promicromonospora umidemergens]|uniref:hypothetical protein n=1 Tax=Promicromonospora umidemergens TaxID=629679 RepID=UPI0020A41E55|nr:hypothetical protein [Promicromonospora umidemergens]
MAPTASGAGPATWAPTSTRRGRRRMSPGEANPWDDLWFYSNPIFLRVSWPSGLSDR